MSSGRPATLDSLAEDLPTSAADVQALRRAAARRPADSFKAVQQLIDALPPAARRPRRETAAGRPEFVL